jgi:hypothetical protein
VKLRYLVAGLFLLILVTYGILAVLVLKLRGGATAGAPGFTAKEAYTVAVQEAQAWQEDSQLVSLNASWRGVGAEAIVAGEEVSWSFAFFSPGTRSLGVFAVSSPGGGQRVGSMDASPNTKTIQPELWQVDSPRVLATFLNQGGREFLTEDSAATVSLRLGPGEDENSMVWLAIGISSDQESTLTVQVDAGTGEILGANPR